jgi:hypothetical protein
VILESQNTKMKIPLVHSATNAIALKQSNAMRVAKAIVKELAVVTTSRRLG